jgi:hypothetical protein
MGRADFLKLGDWNVVCYQCGFKRKASMMEKNWQGYYVCPEHNEPRQPQDFVRAIPDNQGVPWAQPMPTAVYTYTNAQIGIGDGITTNFQFGSGLGSDAVTYNVTMVFVNGTSVLYIVNSIGQVTTSHYVPPVGSIITATGTETVL